MNAARLFNRDRPLRGKSVYQLAKMIRQGIYGGGPEASFEWAERIESNQVRCTLPKKVQRKMGLLPKV